MFAKSFLHGEWGELFEGKRNYIQLMAHPLLSLF
jgi:hypothetical protein